MATKPAEIEYQVVKHNNRSDWFIAQPADRRHTTAPKYQFGYQLFDMPRTCSAREVGAAWVTDGTPPAVQKVIASFLRAQFITFDDNIGVLLAFHHNKQVLDVLSLAGFTEFCNYPGNENEMVHGMRLVIRDDEWGKEYQDSDWDDDYDGDEE